MSLQVKLLRASVSAYAFVPRRGPKGQAGYFVAFADLNLSGEVKRAIVAATEGRDYEILRRAFGSRPK